MKTIEILKVYSKYVKVINNPSSDIIKKFQGCVKWLEENCEDTKVKGTIKLAIVNNTIKVLSERNFRFNEQPTWTKSYNKEFFDLLEKLKKNYKNNDSNPWKVLLGRMYRFLDKIEENSTVYLYFWHHLSVQLIGWMLDSATRDVNHLASAENEEQLERYLNNLQLQP